MNKFKKLLNKKKEIVIIHPHLEQEDDIEMPKKKRFSFNMLKTMNHNNIEPVEKTTISKSTSFLQLNTLFSSSNLSGIKKSRSFFGQLYSTSSFSSLSDNNVSTLVDDQSILIQNYLKNDPILHTAAVSSIYNITDSPTTPVDREKQFDNFQLGLQFYQQQNLEKATHHWKLSATEENELLGSFFYGLALLHGWGCRKSPAMAIRYLEKTTSTTCINDLYLALSQSSVSNSSIYEIGQQFWHGWEVPKNVTMAAYYFELAANMGNPKAMNDLAFCFEYGHGVTKDSFEAAKYYRNAANLGFSVETSSWIWEPQYQEST